MLNEPQKISVSIALRELETRLVRLRTLLDQDSLSQRLTPDALNRLRALLDRQQAIIDELYRRFGLARESIDVVQTMVAEFSIAWTQLVDVRTQKLIRYGEVDPALVSTLDPAISELTELTLATVRILEQARGSSN
jgi:hypothetical protein